jgi:hypothetical protein
MLAADTPSEAYLSLRQRCCLLSGPCFANEAAAESCSRAPNLTQSCRNGSPRWLCASDRGAPRNCETHAESTVPASAALCEGVAGGCKTRRRDAGVSHVGGARACSLHVDTERAPRSARHRRITSPHGHGLCVRTKSLTAGVAETSPALPLQDASKDGAALCVRAPLAPPPV